MLQQKEWHFLFVGGEPLRRINPNSKTQVGERKRWVVGPECETKEDAVLYREYLKLISPTDILILIKALREEGLIE